MHIGLIGGIGPAATDFYYRRLISTFASKNATLELTIVHSDTPTLVSNLARNDAAAQTGIYIRLTNRLVAAGAECVGVTSIGGHFCIDTFKAASPLPVVDMISEVSRAIETRGLKRVGILGTRTVMDWPRPFGVEVSLFLIKAEPGWLTLPQLPNRRYPAGVPHLLGDVQFAQPTPANRPDRVSGVAGTFPSCHLQISDFGEKTFNDQNELDSSTQYGKKLFAEQVVAKHAKDINFSGFVLANAALGSESRGL